MTSALKSRWQRKKSLLLGLRIGVGSALAIIIAKLWGLQNPVAAGSITLLTLSVTRLDQINLVLERLISFVYTIFIGLLIDRFLGWNYVSFMIFLFGVTFITEVLGWSRTLSVNALIGMHFLTADSISSTFILNEFRLLVIGMLIAVVFNQFYNYAKSEAHIYRHIHRLDASMQNILALLESYIRGEQADPWELIDQTESQIKADIRLATELHENSMNKNTIVFKKYFELRQKQLNILSSLHHEIRQIRSIRREGKLLADYLRDMIPAVHYTDIPEKDIQRLGELLMVDEKELKDLSLNKFQDKATVYHIMKDLESFLRLKQQFLQSLTKEEADLFFKNNPNTIHNKKAEA